MDWIVAVFAPLYYDILAYCLIRVNISVQEDTTPGGTPHIKGVGMLVGNFELNL